MAEDVTTVQVGAPPKLSPEEDAAKHRSAGPVYSLEQKYQQAVQIARGAEEGLRRQRKEIDGLLARIEVLEAKTKGILPRNTDDSK
jgi:hypothetical protein